MTKPHVLIISPALAKANNGNWQTAARWSRFLRSRYRVECFSWDEALLDRRRPDVLIVLHARRSAAALVAYDRVAPDMKKVLILTGTDVYRDIHHDPIARAALSLASRLVVLQPAALDELPATLRANTTVIYQSAPSLKPPSSRSRAFNVIMIGHLRAEKDPLTYLRAVTLLKQTPMRFLHVGDALEAELGTAASETAATCPAYRWLGNQSHAATRQHLKRCQLMVITSLMEGGANVIIEAVTCGVPVLASDISGNRGMLGDDYEGYFPTGDSAALASLLRRAYSEPSWLTRLAVQCSQRALLFAPQHEQAAVLDLVDNCLRISDPALS